MNYKASLEVPQKDVRGSEFTVLFDVGFDHLIDT